MSAIDGAYSIYDRSITSPGSEHLNIRTDVGPMEFRKNLEANGFAPVKESTGLNGFVVVLAKDQTIWTIYTRSSTGAFGAQRSASEGVIKYSLGSSRSDEQTR